ncbi:MAG: hypothetical protein ACRDLT_01485 [Solirubrobacteraceae bacterium]
MKLDNELTTIGLDGIAGDRIACGGGGGGSACLLTVAAAAARAWLSGIEAGGGIPGMPGTAGGAGRMNANAYGGPVAFRSDWRRS